MNKLLLLFGIFLLTISTSFSQTLLLEENFDFSGNLVENGWDQHSGNADTINTVAGLVYADYGSSGIGNAALVDGTSQDVSRSFDVQKNDGSSVYYSFLANFTSAAAGTYFTHLGYRDAPTSFSKFSARIFAKDSVGNLRFGFSNSSTVSYSPTDFSYAATYLIVAKYTINAAGSDTAKLWVLTSGVPLTEEDAGAPLFVVSSESNDSLNAVGLRQASGSPNVTVDGIRISDSWTYAPLPVELTSFSAANLNNGVKLSWTTATENNNSGFEIERSRNNKTFNKIGFVSGNGTTTDKSNYSFVDQNVNGKVILQIKAN